MECSIDFIQTGVNVGQSVGIKKKLRKMVYHYKKNVELLGFSMKMVSKT